MNKTKIFRLFTINEDGFYTHINIIMKQNGTFFNRNTIQHYKLGGTENEKIRLKQYRINNKEKLKIQQRKNRNRNKEKVIEYNKMYYQNNKESCDKYNKEYKRNNKDKVKIWGAKNNSNRKGLGYNPINKSFKGSHFHHTFINNDPNIGIHIPAKLHNSIWHSRTNKESMKKINDLAFEWLKNNKDC